MTRRTFTHLVSRLAKADGLPRLARKEAVLIALEQWDAATPPERAALSDMIRGEYGKRKRA